MTQHKKIYDPVHGFIRLDPIEKMLIDSFVFQRLHSIHQLGIAYLVYPGATHTRFEHSLGVMEVATEIFDRVLDKFEEEKRADFIAYWRQVVRLAALCHDLGHLPFSHVAEKRLLGRGGHEKWTLAALLSPYLDPIWKQLETKYPGRFAKEDVIKVSIGEEKLLEIGFASEKFTSWQRVMSSIITGDFFGADRIDYLLRDSKCTGVSYGLFDYHQLIEMLRILKNGDELALGVEENGLESCEALLLARHFMHKRVYQYPSVKALSFHMTRFMEVFYRENEPLKDLDSYLSVTDNEVMAGLRKAYKDKEHPAHSDAVSIFEREHRFQALQLPVGIESVKLEQLKAHFQIDDSAIDGSVLKRRGHTRLCFPILKRNNTFSSAAECTDLMIPTYSIGWLYVAPKQEEALRRALEKLIPVPNQDA